MFVQFAYILWFFFIFFFQHKKIHTHTLICVCVHNIFNFRSFLERSIACIQHWIQNNRLKNQKKKKKKGTIYSNVLTETSAFTLCTQHTYTQHIPICEHSNTNDDSPSNLFDFISTYDVFVYTSIRFSHNNKIHIFIWNFDVIIRIESIFFSFITSNDQHTSSITFMFNQGFDVSIWIFIPWFSWDLFVALATYINNTVRRNNVCITFLALAINAI